MFLNKEYFEFIILYSAAKVLEYVIFKINFSKNIKKNLYQNVENLSHIFENYVLSNAIVIFALFALFSSKIKIELY